MGLLINVSIAGDQRMCGKNRPGFWRPRKNSAYNPPPPVSCCAPTRLPALDPPLPGYHACTDQMVFTIFIGTALMLVHAYRLAMLFGHTLSPDTPLHLGHFFNMATIQENVTLLHSTALALNAI